MFVRVAGDNNDINEDTLDGKRTTQATTLVLFQRGQFGPSQDSTVHMESVQLILVSPEGHVMSGSNVTNALNSEACRMDLA